MLKFKLLFSTLLDSILFFSTLPYPTLPYPTLLYSTLLYSTLLYSTLLCGRTYGGGVLKVETPRLGAKTVVVSWASSLAAGIEQEGDDKTHVELVSLDPRY